MKQLLALLVAPLGLALASGLAALVNQSRPDPGAVYSVAALRAHLTHHASAWVGRPVLVRGFLDGCLYPVCPGHEPYLPPSLIDPNQPATLQVAWEGPDPGWAFLRRMPVLGTLAPAPQALHWEAVGTYRVQLRAMPGSSCIFRPCYEALLLDAVPGALAE